MRRGRQTAITVGRHAKLGQIQGGGGVAEGYPRFDKGGVAIIFYFLRVKNGTF